MEREVKRRAEILEYMKKTGCGQTTSRSPGIISAYYKSPDAPSRRSGRRWQLHKRSFPIYPVVLGLGTVLSTDRE